MIEIFNDTNTASESDLWHFDRFNILLQIHIDLEETWGGWWNRRWRKIEICLHALPVEILEEKQRWLRETEVDSFRHPWLLNHHDQRKQDYRHCYPSVWPENDMFDAMSRRNSFNVMLTDPFFVFSLHVQFDWQNQIVTMCQWSNIRAWIMPRDSRTESMRVSDAHRSQAVKSLHHFHLSKAGEK